MTKMTNIDQAIAALESCDGLEMPFSACIFINEALTALRSLKPATEEEIRESIASADWLFVRGVRWAEARIYGRGNEPR